MTQYRISTIKINVAQKWQLMQKIHAGDTILTATLARGSQIWINVPQTRFWGQILLQKTETKS
jgi:hypothetical protein